jgi:hypothetical protein
MAHRGLSDARAFGGLGDASFASEGVEGDQKIEVDLVEVLRDMSSAHASIKTSH